MKNLVRPLNVPVNTRFLFVFVAGLLLSASLLPAATWYVDAAAGSGGSGTSGDPFATIQQAADVANAGDVVNIRAGVYRETVTPANSGNAGNPIVFQQDPASAGAVVVSGADVLSGWVLDSSHPSGRVYKTSMPWNLNPDNDDPDFGHVSGNQIFVDGQMVLEARWPNSGLDLSMPNFCFSEDGYSSASSGWLENHRIQDELPQGNTLNGAIIQMSPGERWGAYSAYVSSVSADRINISGDLFRHDNDNYKLQHETPFFIFGKKELLDIPGEWWFDESSNELYLWAPTGVDPSLLTVESKRRVLGFDLSNRDFITVKDIEIFAAALTTTRQFDQYQYFHLLSEGVTLDGLKATYVSHDRFLPGDTYWVNQTHDTGIMLIGSNHIIRNSVIGFSSGNLLLAPGENNLIENNILHDANYLGCDGANLSLGHFNAYSRNHMVRNNTAYRSGRMIFLIRSIKNTKILNNHIYVSNLQTTDTGAIMMYQNDAEGSEIAYNIVQDIAGPRHGGAGIYMDERSEDIIIHHNLVFNCQGALRLNEPIGIHVYNNTLIGTESSVGGMPGNLVTDHVTWAPQYGFADTGVWETNYIRNNIFGKDYMFRLSTYSNNLPNVDNPEWASYAGGDIPGGPAYPDPAPDFRFVDPAGGNFQLQAGSAAIDAGMTGTDDGVLIPPYALGGNQGAPDIGAFEYGKTPWTAGADFTIEPTVPGNLSLVGVSGNEVTLSWEDNSNDEKTFVLERSLDLRTFDVVATLPANTTSYTDYTNPNIYYYRVRADSSEFSNYLKVNMGRSALSRIEAESFDEDGAETPGGDGVQLLGIGITSLGPDDYMMFKDVTFSSDINKISFMIKSGYNVPIEFRLGSVNAPVVATFTPPNLVWSQPEKLEEGAVSGFPDGTYDLYITAGSFGNPGNIDWFQFSNGSTLPNAPVNLVENAGQLTWVDTADSEAGFKVERSLDNITWEEIASVSADVTTYAAGTGYLYRVRAYNVFGNSNYSNIAGASLNAAPEEDVPNVPLSLAAENVNASTISLSWLDLSEIEDGYVIERSTNPASGFAPIVASPRPANSTTAFDNSGLVVGTTYYYRVKATNGAFESLYSNVASATPQAALLVNPPFAYEDFESGTNAGGEGWAGNWTYAYGALTELPALPFSGLFGDNTMSVSSDSITVDRSLATPLNYASEDVWMGYLFSASANAGSSGLRLNQGSSSGALDMQFNVLESGGDFVFFNYIAGQGSEWSTSGSPGSTYLQVVRFSDSGGTTTVDVWRFTSGSAPDREADLGAPTASFSGPTSNGLLESVQLKVYNNTLAFDEIRFADSYEAAIGLESDSVSGFASWASTTIGSSNAGPSDDADGDGLKNLLEYALNLNPVAADTHGLSIAQDGSELVVTYQRDTSKTDISYQIEETSNLSGTWTASTNESVIASNGSIQTVEVRTSLASGKFLRLCVGQNP